MATTNVTLGEVEVLSNQERTHGFTHKWTVDYTDVDEGSGNSDDVIVTLGNTPSNFLVARVLVNVTTAFAGTAGTFAIEVGTDGDDDNFIASTSVKTAGTIIAAAGGAPATAAGSHDDAADVLTATFTNGTSGAPEDLTAGSCDIYLQLIELP